MTLAIGHGLLRGALQVDGADHRSIHRIDDRVVRGAVAEDVNSLVKVIEEDAIGSTLHVDRLDRSHRLGVPHGNRFTACEAVV